ncbi:MAG: hypothetical protein AAB664_00130 [Patescibacteria group bacterium]
MRCRVATSMTATTGAAVVAKERSDFATTPFYAISIRLVDDFLCIVRVHDIL